jgi:S-(hydroxymethyl)glutathione dehydrogenase / alcohol dehydrogenase
MTGLDGTAVRAVVLDDPARGPEVYEIRLAAPGPHEVEVAVSAAGVCGSDLHVALGESSTRAVRSEALQ